MALVTKPCGCVDDETSGGPGLPTSRCAEHAAWDPRDIRQRTCKACGATGRVLRAFVPDGLPCPSCRGVTDLVQAMKEAEEKPARRLVDQLADEMAAHVKVGPPILELPVTDATHPIHVAIRTAMCVKEVAAAIAREAGACVHGGSVADRILAIEFVYTDPGDAALPDAKASGDVHNHVTTNVTQAPPARDALREVIDQLAREMREAGMSLEPLAPAQRDGAWGGRTGAWVRDPERGTPQPILAAIDRTLARLVGDAFEALESAPKEPETEEQRQANRANKAEQRLTAAEARWDLAETRWYELCRAVLQERGLPFGHQGGGGGSVEAWEHRAHRDAVARVAHMRAATPQLDDETLHMLGVGPSWSLRDAVRGMHANLANAETTARAVALHSLASALGLFPELGDAPTWDQAGDTLRAKLAKLEEMEKRAESAESMERRAVERVGLLTEEIQALTARVTQAEKLAAGFEHHRSALVGEIELLHERLVEARAAAAANEDATAHAREACKVLQAKNNLQATAYDELAARLEKSEADRLSSWGDVAVRLDALTEEREKLLSRVRGLEADEKRELLTKWLLWDALSSIADTMGFPRSAGVREPQEVYVPRMVREVWIETVHRNERQAVRLVEDANAIERAVGERDLARREGTSLQTQLRMAQTELTRLTSSEEGQLARAEQRAETLAADCRALAAKLAEFEDIAAESEDRSLAEQLAAAARARVELEKRLRHAEEIATQAGADALEERARVAEQEARNAKAHAVELEGVIEGLRVLCGTV